MTIKGWVLTLIGSSCLFAQPNACLLKARQAGPVRIGMTVRQARAALKDATLTKGEDGEGLRLLSVKRGGERLMDLYPDNDATNPETADIEVIRVFDPKCATAEGVHPGSLLADVEKSYGKLLRLETTEIESREYAEFTKQPMWAGFQAGSGEAGVYPKGKRCAPAYAAGAKVQSIWVSKPLKSIRYFEDDSACNTAGK